ncbi:TIGR03013 family PEP-CTERM/XrtA system glycosyltransferase [Thiohalobacter sp. IOR34]|uniref:TIGR03013 family XrtA/PEP-CTERM system glycosyltransferase n=1 Tax=Thiohalobacter sp. IOR34 TaxID=3057176 RepID=UPI0025B20D2D|nr:TIGR03013 family XrtA/PEP-CTERM system glycosyltransferase [Thiohalobacter sp. IOR34]WJW74478.1 TIGR03013 family PEP-CTERM/XrtA system glycosyltransferase [Thiohalobacter sp. IOR34]
MATIRIFRHYIPTAFLLLGLLEGVVFVLAFYAGVEVRFWNADPATIEKVQPLLPKALVYALALLLSMAGMGLYERRTRDGFEGILLRVIASLALSLIPLALIFYIAPSFYLGRGALAISYSLALIGSVLLRVMFMRLGDQEALKKRVLILGTGERAAMIRRYRRSSDLRGIRVVGYVRMGDKDVVEPERILELDQPLSEYVTEHDIDELVVAVDDRRRALPVQELLDCKMNGKDVIDLLTFFEREMGKIKLDILDPSWLYLSDGFRQGATRTYVKRGFDILMSLLMLPFMLPLMGLVAIAILVESGGQGPVLYRQVRVGAHGRPFRIIKFRSMRVDAEKDGARWAEQNDDRVTRVGAVIRKVRLDELPQLFNVLKGEMSFVGPRPERPEFVEQLAKSIPYFEERHRVKPGLTGWAQISYQYGSSEEDAFEKQQYDLYYVKNYSLLLDLLILLETVEVVLLGKGAH